MKLKTAFVVLLCALCSTTTNSQADTQSVAGPDVFVTDGTKDLNLTCENDISAVFGWFFPGNDSSRDCDSRPAKNVCNFRPRLDDDMQNVTCIATHRPPSKSFQANYTLNLLYPPESRAAISIEPPQTEPLKQGDNITCTVSGGKPPVTNVTFHCQHPDLADQDDDVSDDGRNVSSSITVNTSQATEVNMTCTCSAHWDPEPELYDDITNAEFMLEYKAVVTNFTVNDSTSKTVAESEKVMFWCQGAGRPSPSMILRKRGNDTAIRSGSPPEEGLQHPIGSARCEDLGNYTCEANNNFDNPNSETVQLYVKCSTRPADDSDDIANIYNLTQAGRTFTVVGYPTPKITVSFCGNTTRACQPAGENAFVTSCERNVTMEHLVHCAITPVNITQDKTGLYNMTMNNTLGNVTVTFQILHAVTPPEPTLPPADNGLSTVTIIVITVTSTGGGGLAVTVTVIVIVIKKKKKAHRRKSCYNTPQQSCENNALRSKSGQTSQRVTATVQPQVHSQAHHNHMSPVFMVEPGYACPADMLPSGGIHAAEVSTIKPSPYDPGYASADEIGMSTDAQRVAFNPRNNSLKSRSANQYCDIPFQPAEPANKPNVSLLNTGYPDDGVDDYNVLGGQGATSGPDPTYSHIHKVNKNQ